MVQKSTDIVAFGGIGSLRRKIMLRVEEPNPKPRTKPTVKKLYGFMDLIHRYSVEELRTAWGGFLNGEEIYLPKIG